LITPLTPLEKTKTPTRVITEKEGLESEKAFEISIPIIGFL